MQNTTKVAFSTDKHGKLLAYRVSMRQFRNFRISLDRASEMLKTGEAVEVPYRPFGKFLEGSDKFYTVSTLESTFPAIADAVAAWERAGRPKQAGSSVWVTEHQGVNTLRTITLEAA